MQLWLKNYLIKTIKPSMSTSNQENLETFLRITKTVAGKNERPSPFHLKALFEEHDPPIINELDQALEEAGNCLTNDQCACLFANVANLNFENGRVKDRTLIRNAEKSLRIDSGDARTRRENTTIQIRKNKNREQVRRRRKMAAGQFVSADASAARGAGGTRGAARDPSTGFSSVPRRCRRARARSTCPRTRAGRGTGGR